MSHGISVLSVASEMFPLVKTGGLADVTGALPLALAEQGVKAITLIPGYPAVIAALDSAHPIFHVSELFGGPVRVLSARAADLDLLVIDAPHLYDRPGSPYVELDGSEWPDNGLRFGALGWIAAQICLGEVPGFRPDVVHCHDWQAGLTLAYLAYDGRPRPASVMTVHNLAYQGKFPASLLSELRLPAAAFQIDGVEYYGSIGYLKAGLQFADRITTVSPTYAAEMQSPENGFGLDGLLRFRANIITGITNGIDTAVWDPSRDKRIPATFDATTLDKRAANKLQLQRRFELEESGNLLFGVVSRLAWQKGLDILAEAMPVLLESGAQIALLGAGDQELEQRLSALAIDHPGRIGCIIGYDEDTAHLIQAGSDAILVPSRFEPCGLTQLCGLRYGAVPIVAKVGGLADTVLDAEDAAGHEQDATGFHFHPVTREALENALRRAAASWPEKDRWRQMQRNGMRTDVSWQHPAQRYVRLYTDLLAARNKAI